MMTRDVFLRPEAERDINEIADYTIRRWGKAQARAYVAELRRALEGLASTAGRHPAATAIRPGLRRLRCRHHLIFYGIVDKTVDVVRILHERQDVPGEIDGDE